MTRRRRAAWSATASRAGVTCGDGAQLLAMKALNASELGRCERLLTRSSRGWEAVFSALWVLSASFTVPSSHQPCGLGQHRTGRGTGRTWPNGSNHLLGWAGED